MNKLLVFAERDWSYGNLSPALTDIKHIRVKSFKEFFNNYSSEISLVITCEQHASHWKYIYKELNKLKHRAPVLSLQQGLFYSTSTNPNAAWYADKHLVWGKQMYEAGRRNNIYGHKMIITGCPKHDKMFNDTTSDEGYYLGLEGGEHGERIDASMFGDKPVIIVPHPNKTEHELKYDTYNLIKKAHEVVIYNTGCGIWALILKKKYKILGTNERYLGHEFPDFVQWAVTDNKASKRINNLIKEYTNV